VRHGKSVLYKEQISGNKEMVKPEEFLQFLRSLGIETTTITHEALFTVEESLAHTSKIEGAQSKNLLVKDKKGQVYALITLAQATLNLKTLHEKIGASGRLSFASEAQLLALWGVRPGSVTPFGAINDKELAVKVILDSALMAHARLNFHPLVNIMTTTIAAQDLVTFLRATGHEPTILPISD
jgi:Ala-tRNA(Pro) deacylase